MFAIKDTQIQETIYFRNTSQPKAGNYKVSYFVLACLIP